MLDHAHNPLVVFMQPWLCQCCTTQLNVLRGLLLTIILPSMSTDGPMYPLRHMLGEGMLSMDGR